MSFPASQTDHHDVVGARQAAACGDEVAFERKLAELTDHIERATSAICANDLAMLEQIVKDQQILCAELGETLRSVIGKGGAQLPQNTHADVMKAIDRNDGFLLLLQGVTLHAQSLQRLYRSNGEERWPSDRLPLRSLEGRYV